MSINRNECWADLNDSTSVYYCYVLRDIYGVTYHIQEGRVFKWFWRDSTFFGSRFVKVLLSDIPEKVRECFLDPFLEIELERFKISGERTMDIL